MPRIVRRRSPVRRAVASALVGIAGLLLVVAIVAIWANDLLLSPGRWETSSTKLLDSQAIRTSVANYLADEVAARLPAQIPVTGPESAAAVRASVFRAVDTAVTLAAVQTLWEQANRSAASAVLNIVDGQDGPTTGTAGAVTIDLGPVLRAAGADGHLPAAVAAELPADLELAVVPPDQANAARTAGRTLRDLARWLPIIVPLLWLAALALAAGRRRRMLAWIGITAAIAAALVIGARAVVAKRVADAISANPGVRTIIAAAITTVTGSLDELALVVGVVGLVVALIAGLAGLRSAGLQYSRVY